MTSLKITSHICLIPKPIFFIHLFYYDLFKVYQGTKAGRDPKLWSRHVGLTGCLLIWLVPAWHAQFKKVEEACTVGSHLPSSLCSSWVTWLDNVLLCGLAGLLCRCNPLSTLALSVIDSLFSFFFFFSCLCLELYLFPYPGSAGSPGSPDFKTTILTW